METIKHDQDLKPLDYFNARKGFLIELDKVLIDEFKLKKKKKELLKNMKEWDGKLLLM